MGIWLFVAIWLTSGSPRDYRVIAKVGPFNDIRTCYAAGALQANQIQSKDDVTNVLGACVQGDKEARFMDYKSMWGMVCASEGKSDLCWVK